MDFERLYNNISLRLKKIAKRLNGHGYFIDEDDLYQEMCLHLWNNYRDGVPEGINDSYIIKGCEFHARNYIRKKKKNFVVLGLEEPIGEDGNTLKDILRDRGEPLDVSLNRKMIIEDIKNNGFTKRQKEVFLLILEGYTVREIGNILGISHVMVIKYKSRLIEKYCREIGQV